MMVKMVMLMMMMMMMTLARRPDRRHARTKRLRQHARLHWHARQVGTPHHTTPHHTQPHTTTHWWWCVGARDTATHFLTPQHTPTLFLTYKKFQESYRHLLGPTATSPQKKQAFLQATKKGCSNVILRQFNPSVVHRARGRGLCWSRTGGHCRHLR